MKLVYCNLDINFELVEDKLNFIVVENKNSFDKFITSISNSINKKSEEVCLYEECTKIEIDKISDVVLSPTDFYYDKRDIQKKLISNLIYDIESSEISLELVETSSKLFNLVEKIEFNSEYPIDYIEYLSNEMLLKFFEIKLKNPEGKYVERLIEYTRNVHRLLGKKIFFVLSASSFMTEYDFRYSIEYSKYEGIIILFLEPNQLILNIEKNECIIDVDLCSIK